MNKRDKTPAHSADSTFPHRPVSALGRAHLVQVLLSIVLAPQHLCHGTVPLTSHPAAFVACTFQRKGSILCQTLQASPL